MVDFHVIIPARYHSTRLPAKALAKIGDKTMIEHVYAQAVKSGALSVTVATDDERILHQVVSAGGKAVLTASDHPSGSDRVYEAAEILGLDEKAIIVNVQGDEPFIPVANIKAVANLLADNQNQMATLCCPINSSEEALDPNAVKVVFSANNKALYFSRSLIPFNRDNPVRIDKPLNGDYFRHIGIYAYRKGFLKSFINWSTSQLELTESLEQLRVLENGASIAISALEEMPPQGVDTPADLELAREHYQSLLDK